MFVFSKICFVSSILTIFASISYSSVIPAAVIRRHTVHYKDVPAEDYKPIQHPVVYVPSSMVNLFVHFRSKSSQVHLRQIHKGGEGQVQHSVSSDEPHYLKHEVKKPVIQHIREVIVPYRQVIQEIKPVVEEVKTVVATGVPKSTMYMNFGSQYSNQNSYGDYPYVMKTNHESGPQYQSVDNAVSHQNSVQSSSVPSNDNLHALYDLSSIYGIKPTADSLAGYLMSAQNIQDNHNNQNSQDYSSPLVYGLTNDIQTESGTATGYQYNGNEIHQKSAENNVQDTGYGNRLIPSYQKDNTVEQNESPVYDQTYDYVEPQYYVTEIEPKNNHNSNAYYSDNYGSGSQQDSSSGYATQNVINPGYSGEYSGDLATSDGSALENASPVLPLMGPFATVPITKSTTLATLAQLMSSQLMSSLPYQYSYENGMNMKTSE